MTPADLINAASEGDLARVRAALDAGVDVDAPEGSEPWHQNALFAAADAGHVDVVTLLLDRGADIHHVGPADMTALHAAVRSGRLATMKLLLARGAPASVRVLEDVIHVAQMTAVGHPAAPEILQRHRIAMVKPSLEGEGAQAQLQVAAEAGDVEAVRAALAAGGDVSQRDERGMEALSWAALRGHVAVIELLLQAGAAPDQPNSSGWPPIGQAAGQGHAGAVRALIAGGADPGQAFDGGRTALMCAAYGGHESTVEALLEGGADPMPTYEGQTALSLARMQGHTGIATRLQSGRAAR